MNYRNKINFSRTRLLSNDSFSCCQKRRSQTPTYPGQNHLIGSSFPRCVTCASHCVSPGFIGKITLQIPFYRPHSDPWVISMSQLNLIIGPAHQQEYDGEKERGEERERKACLLKALEDKFKVGG